MLQLPNSCTASTPSVFPKNWKTGNASLLKQDWRIQYYFKDPSSPYMVDHPRGKFVVIKGMNYAKTLDERRQATKDILENELRLLKIEGYNPISKQSKRPADTTGCDIRPSDWFTSALTMAMERLAILHRTKVEIKSIIKAVEGAAVQLGIISTPVEQITRRHIKSILDRCAVNNPKWSNTRYNKYRGYLMMLYKELVEQEAVPFNVIHDIYKKPMTSKIKKVLSEAERKKIDKHLAERYPAFRMFVHLFFHSGGRKPELLQLKPSMVNLSAQKYRCLVKKGKGYREVERTIKSIAVPYWKYFLDQCPADQFLFGPGFRPAAKAMIEDYPTRCWQEYVKKDLGIEKDFYSLKHLNTGEVVDALDEAAAAELNAHKGTGMVVKIYDTKQQERQHNRLKDVGNEFV